MRTIWIVIIAMPKQFAVAKSNSTSLSPEEKNSERKEKYFLFNEIYQSKKKSHENLNIHHNNFVFTVEKTPSGFPVITQSPQTRVIEIGHTAVMQCRSTGNPTPKIYWLKDGKRLEMNQRYTLIDGKLE